MKRWWGGLLAGLLLGAVPVAAAASADLWYVHYENGERALAERDWRGAVSELSRAIERRSDSGLRLRTDGSRLVNYFPYLKLGIAYAELGDHDAALRAFDTEERLGLVAGVPEALATLRSERQRTTEARARSFEEARVLSQRRAEILARSKTEARAHLDQGRFDDGMRALASGLAVAPDDGEALALMEQLREGLRQAAPPAPASRQESTAVPTAESGVADSFDSIEIQIAESDLAEGRSEDALAAANRVLAIDRGNAAALDIVRRAYAEISRRLLGVAPAEGAPPILRFANPRAQAGGELVQRVEDPGFELSGVAVSRTAVTVEAFEGTRALEVATSSQGVGDTFITEFRVPLQLVTARSTLAVVARDERGATSRGEFTVLFESPWYRSIFSTVAAASLVALAALAAAALLWRGYRARVLRRALGERGFNPYVAGGPVFDQALFYGREPLIRRILQTVHSNSLMLHGERRIGKTSLLHQVRLRLAALDDPEYRFHAVYIDLQGTREHQLFATMADQIFEGLGESVASDRTPALVRDAYDHHDLVRELHGVLGVLQSRSDRAVRLVLLIDEVDELNHYDPRVNQKLRSLFMKSFSESLVAVVAGVGIRKEWEREGSPWYNFFEEVAVEPIAVEAARELVLAPIRGVFKVEPGVADDIVARCDRRPFRIQRLCRALVNRLHETGRTTITGADVLAVVE